MVTCPFEHRVDARLPGEVSTRDLVRRIARLDDELETLRTDEVHVQTHCFGAERLGHLKKIRSERTTARAKRETYVEELRKRTP